MFGYIYIEESVINHALTQQIIKRFSDVPIVPCNRYTEIFNRKAQNFRLQKHKPALILASKHKNFVLPAPKGYGIGANKNYYFSHMLNCIYDCRYCFLQGMYRSAHYVLFVNYDDYELAIQKIVENNDGEIIHFFSGYDCDSLALEPVTGFTEYFLPVFKKYPATLLELRTKSTQIRSLLATAPHDNVVVAYSFTPNKIASALEHKTPDPERRLNAMYQLQQNGWLLGLRFDPLIYVDDFRDQYRQLFSTVFNRLDINFLHSVSIGNFRLPHSFFKTISRLYPDEKLFASPLEENNRMVSYQQKIIDTLTDFCLEELSRYVPQDKLFNCDSSYLKYPN